MRTFTIAALALAGLGGCVEGEEPELGTDSDEIIGGYEVVGHRGVVEIDGCTGFLLSDSVIVTAAHCLLDAGPSPANFVVNHFDPEHGKVVIWDGPLEYGRHPEHNWDAPKCGNSNDFCKASHDVAYLHATTGKWRGTSYVDYLRTYDDLGNRLGEVRMWGQGYNSNAGGMHSGLGTLRHRVFDVNAYIDNIIETLGTETHVVCGGDSGGPVIKDASGLELVAGVNSSSEKATDADQCSYDGGQQWETRTNHEHIGWVADETGIECAELSAHTYQYKRCFDLPFIDVVDEEGLDRELATAIAMTAL